MSRYTIIDQDDQLVSACVELSNAGTVALDTEFIRVNTYYPILCLVQMSGGSTPFLVDPLAIKNLDPLQLLLASTGVETVLHSCRQDMEALDTRMKVAFGSLFDTQLAAAFCGFGDQVSYAVMVSEVTGITLPKAHTRADWLKRPLPTEELLYAADDVRFLHPLRDFLAERLDQSGKMAWFREECQQQLNPAVWRPDSQKAWQRLKGGVSLPVHAQETARRLAIWREEQAEKSDHPREWVLSTREILSISQAGPRSMTELQRVKGVSRNTVHRYGDSLVRLCRSAPRERTTSAIWTKNILSPEDRVRVKGIMRLLQSTSEEFGISPSLLANRSTVEEFVKGTLETDLFCGWRRKVIGDRELAEFS